MTVGKIRPHLLVGKEIARLRPSGLSIHRRAARTVRRLPAPLLDARRRCEHLCGAQKATGTNLTRPRLPGDARVLRLASSRAWTPPGGDARRGFNCNDIHEKAWRETGRPTLCGLKHARPTQQPCLPSHGCWLRLTASICNSACRHLTKNGRQKRALSRRHLQVRNSKRTCASGVRGCFDTPQ